jgi:hypothetical protein
MLQVPADPISQNCLTVIMEHMEEMTQCHKPLDTGQQKEDAETPT